ncbi:cyclohexyl-isocyanide hydratase [Caldalkalibacillus uzonensis]|uniref:Cyclohexyl-isocyanide hydratase n=1 Tax=Caldalkalibacillus uzonensis TaxID=353224 RepID=A0ABU0CR25_9BACI|nr:DJ-1/PfpI family protein [Caldalkalibacillus uzonensis]MDQ0338855.1 cyclohexyl-isocyanide hydratase [Caldalkalibacillus uzonensis]
MKIAFILFDRLTVLDFIGFYDVITRLKTMAIKPEVKWDLCALKEQVADELGVRIKVDRVRPDLGDYDMIFVPGGMGTRQLKDDSVFINWLKTARDVHTKVSVCTGSLLLGAAGFLKGKKATTHPNAYTLLSPYCAQVVEKRIVKDGNIITGGGVATSIDLGLYMLEELAGHEAVQRVQRQMDYPYYPSKEKLL